MGTMGKKIWHRGTSVQKSCSSPSEKSELGRYYVQQSSIIFKGPNLEGGGNGILPFLSTHYDPGSM